MSNFVAEAQVKIVPVIDRVALNAQLAAATKSASAGMAGLATSTGLAAGGARQLNRTAETTTARLVGLGSATGRLDAALLGLRTAAGSAAVIGLSAGALAAIAMGKAIRSLIADTARFETTLNVFQATTGATAHQMQQVADAAKQLGADITLPSVTASDAADAMTELAKAGLSVQDSIDGARGVLQLATAAAISNAEAVSLAASALNAFGLSGRDAAMVADVFANAANLAQGSIQDVALANQQAAAVARQAGLSFQDTATFLTILARNGLRGSDAGTSLRVTLLRLIAPTKQAGDEMKKLGINVLDATGNVRVDVFQQLQLALAGMAPEARNAALSLIFGTDAIRAASILSRQSVRDLLRYREGIREQGTAAEVAGARTKGLAGASQALASTLQTAGLRIGQSWAPALEGLVQGTTSAVAAIADSRGLTEGLATATETVTTAFSALGSVLQLIGPALIAVTNALGHFTSALGGQTIAVMLGTVAAIKVLRSEMVATFAYSLVLRARLLASAIVILAGSFTGMATPAANLRAGFGAIASILPRLMSSTTGVVAGVAALAAGVYYLSTRETETERATRRLKEANDALATSMQEARTAAETLAGAQRSSLSGQLNLVQAQLARDEAAAALASSGAARGSLERRRLEVALAVAIQNVTFAQQDYKKSLDDLARAQDVDQAARNRRQKSVRDEITETRNLITATQEELAVEQRRQSGFGGPALRAQQADLYRKALQGVIDQERKWAKEEINAGDADTIRLGRRRKLLADLQALTGKFKPVRVDVLFNTNISTDRLFRILERQLKPQFAKLGFESAQEFRTWLMRELGLKLPDSAQKMAYDLYDGVHRGLQDFMNQNPVSVDVTVQPHLKMDTAYLLAEVEGAGNASLLAIAQANLAKAENVLERAKAKYAKHPTKANEDFVARAAGLVQKWQEEVRRLQGEIDSTAKDAADKVATARQKADQAVLDAVQGIKTSTQTQAQRRFAGKVAAAQAALTAAQDTKQLSDDIKAYQRLIALNTQGIAWIKKYVKNYNDKTAAIKILTDANAEYGQAIKKLQDQQAQNAADAAQAARDARKTHLEAMLSIAETTPSVADDRRAIEAIAQFDRNQIARLMAIRKKRKLTQEEKAQLDAYKVDLAQRNEALRNLKKTTDESAKRWKELEFSFLQMQTGFVSTLIGNLIPGFATGGLVSGGGGGGGTTGPPTMAEIAQANINTQRPYGGNAPAFAGRATPPPAASGKPAGPTSGQAQTTNHLLLEIRNLLFKLNRGTEHPEAKQQRSRGAAAYDYGYQGPGF